MKLLTTAGGWYRYDIPPSESPTGRRLRGACGTKDRAAAQAMVARLLAGETPQQVEGMTLKQACDRALSEVWHRHKAQQFFNSSCSVLCDLFGAKTQLKDINADAIRKAKAVMVARGNSPGTINRRLAVLSKLLRVARMEWQALGDLPVLRREREPKGRTRVYSVDEQKAILEWFREHDYEMYRLAFVLFGTGCRVSEALRIDPRRDLRDGKLTLRETKNGDARTIPVAPKVVSMIGDGLTPRDSDDVGKRWLQMRIALGYANDKEFVAHTVRHTVATRLLENGWDVVKVRDWLGHKDIKTTAKYLHLVTRNMEDGAAFLAVNLDVSRDLRVVANR